MIHEDHKAFARAVVALARTHGMTDLTLNFRFGFDKEIAAAQQGAHDPVTMSWCAGRHGDDGRINLESRSFESLDERATHQGDHK